MHFMGELKSSLMHFNMDMGNYNRVVLYFVHHKFMRRQIHKTMKNTKFM